LAAKVKICGLTTWQAARAAAAADYAGFVFFARSPRYVTAPQAAKLAAHLPRRVERVALMVDPDDAFLRATLLQFRPDVLQLHGRETPERVAEIRHRFSIKVMKAIGIADAADLERARAYEGVVDLLMFDAKPPEGASRPGGNAQVFDWSLLAGRSWRVPWLLAGGLDPSNVAAAIRASGAPGVDVSSGVEDRPGHKVPAKIRAFVRAAGGR
jgi:phosphoribosylanthranilate isomerase